MVREKLIQTFEKYLVNTNSSGRLLEKVEYIIDEIMERSSIFKLTSVQHIKEQHGSVYSDTNIFDYSLEQHEVDSEPHIFSGVEVDFTNDEEFDSNIEKLIQAFVVVTDNALSNFIKENKMKLRPYNPQKYYKCEVVTAIYQPFIRVNDYIKGKNNIWGTWIKFVKVM